jgi:hypothetical protein
MLRSIVGVVIGYLAIVAIVFVTFSIAYLSMGTGRAFQPGTYDVSLLWVAVSLILGFVAAMVGGVVCKAISGRSGSCKALAGLVVVLGFLMAIPAVTAAKPASQPVRAATVSNLEAMRQAQQPAWLALVNPILGAAGVLVGGRRGRVAAPPASQ